MNTILRPTNGKPIRPPNVLYTPVDERNRMLNLTPAELAIWSNVYARVMVDTRSQVKALSAAIGAVNRSAGRDFSVASMHYKPTRQIAGWGVVFGSPKVRDSHGTYFTRRSRLHLLRGQYLPLRWDHAEGAPIGHVTGWKLYPSYGYWITAVVTAFFAEFFINHAATGRLHFSSAVPAADVVQSAAGELLSWPIDEFSACPNPSDSGVGSIILDYPGLAA